MLLKEFSWIQLFLTDAPNDWHIGTQSKLKTGTLNMKYSGYCSSNKPEYLSSMQYASIGRENFDIQRTGKYEEQQHVADIRLSGCLKSKNTLRITADYLNQYNKDKGNATESSINSEKRLF